MTVTKAEHHPNEEQTLNVTISPESNEYLFESDNEMVATISYDGKVTAKGYGKAKIIAKTEDLNKNPIFTENIITEHEKMFTEEGIPTKAIIAKL